MAGAIPYAEMGSTMKMYQVAAARHAGGLFYCDEVQGKERRSVRVIVAYPPDGM